MSRTLSSPEQSWCRELESRAEAAVRRELVKRYLAELPPEPRPMPNEQWLGMAITFLLIGALLASALLLSLFKYRPDVF
jgi:hypothetical protein